MGREEKWEGEEEEWEEEEEGIQAFILIFLLFRIRQKSVVQLYFTIHRKGLAGWPDLNLYLKMGNTEKIQIGIRGTNL